MTSKTLAAIAAMALVAFAGAARADDDATPKHDWGVAYYMSYDNNLEGCGQPIIKMIREGVKAPNVVAAVQADFTDDKGMKRFTITKDGQKEEAVASEDSADENQAIAYFEWFVKTFPCKHYVFTFLDHGGQLDQMCADENPGESGKQWMSGRVMGEKLRAFTKKLPAGSNLALLFLQQCGRGSIENLYSFRGTAEHVMSSPVPVGAPNTYYKALGEWLAAHPDATGAEVAARIAAEDDHYTIYTCLRTPKLDELPARLDAMVAPFLAAKKLARPELPDVIHPVGEPIVDAKKFFEALSSANQDAGAKEVAAFFEWTRKELFTEVTFHKRRKAMASELCGLSVFAALEPGEARKYRKLDVFKNTNLASLWKKLASPEDEAPAPEKPAPAPAPEKPAPAPEAQPAPEPEKPKRRWL